MTTDLPEEEDCWLTDEAEGADDFLPPGVRYAWERAGEAIETGDEAALRRILADHPGLAGDFLINGSLLTEAAELGRAGAVAALLEAGVPPDLISESGGTPLMAAASNGHLEVARLLLAAGADPDILVEDHCRGGDPEVVGLCALHFAQVRGHQDLVDLLEPATHPEVRELAARATRAELERRAAAPPPPPPAFVELFRAIAADDPVAVRAALAAGADVNGRDDQGTSPLWLAAAGGRGRALPVLLEHGAEVDAPGQKVGETALTAAVRFKREALLAPLMAAGADPDRPDGAGMTAWQMARIQPGDDSRLDALRRACEEVRDIARPRVADRPGRDGRERPGDRQGDSESSR